MNLDTSEFPLSLIGADLDRCESQGIIINDNNGTEITSNTVLAWVLSRTEQAWASTGSCSCPTRCLLLSLIMHASRATNTWTWVEGCICSSPLDTESPVAFAAELQATPHSATLYSRLPLHSPLLQPRPCAANAVKLQRQLDESSGYLNGAAGGTRGPPHNEHQ